MLGSHTDIKILVNLTLARKITLQQKDKEPLQLYGTEISIFHCLNQWIESCFYSNVITFERREGVGDNQGHPIKNNSGNIKIVSYRDN